MIAPTNARPGRNEPCHCGSGQKYKRCCLAMDDANAAVARATAAAAVDSVPADAETSATAAPRAPKHQTQQPWRNTTSRGFVPRSTTPRKAGGS